MSNLLESSLSYNPDKTLPQSVSQVSHTYNAKIQEPSSLDL